MGFLNFLKNIKNSIIKNSSHNVANIKNKKWHCSVCGMELDSNDWCCPACGGAPVDEGGEAKNER